MQTFVLTAGQQQQQHNLKRNSEVRDKRQSNCRIILTLYLLLSGDVHQCPGPTTRNINREVTKSNNPVSQVRDTHRESTVIEYIHQPNVMPCVCCPSGGDGLAKLCRLGSGTAGAEERRSGTPRAVAVAVGEGSVRDRDRVRDRNRDRDRLAAFGHSVEDTPMAMEKVSFDPHGISNLTGLRCPANPEVGCCVQVQTQRVSQFDKQQHAYKSNRTINPVFKKHCKFNLFKTVNHSLVIWDQQHKPKGIFGGHLNIRSLTPKGTDTSGRR
ncbi:hypothetical protein NQZ68_016849 [Dissostichus eleginoides]|nr:hypothetical protein NQZ68_016849 [Dissostichus eleginoides]